MTLHVHVGVIRRLQARVISMPTECMITASPIDGADESTTPTPPPTVAGKSMIYTLMTYLMYVYIDAVYSITIQYTDTSTSSPAQDPTVTPTQSATTGDDPTPPSVAGKCMMYIDDVFDYLYTMYDRV